MRWRRRIGHLSLLAAAGLFCCLALTAYGAENGEQGDKQEESERVQDLRDGKNFLETKVYSLEEDKEILKLYEGLRVADVSDGMDKAGLAHVGRMSTEILPAWEDYEGFEHRFVGIAVTARYVPTNRPIPQDMSAEEFNEWVSDWYQNTSSEAFRPLIREGTALVIDEASGVDVGSIGSNNIMSWRAAGCVGVVTDGTARDTDEVAAEGIPLYYRGPGRGIRPGRNELESVNRPIDCGGVLVEPGDVVVADGDGVIVVPRRRAREVALYARDILTKDKAGRRELYEELGIPLDESVK